MPESLNVSGGAPASVPYADSTTPGAGAAGAAGAASVAGVAPQDGGVTVVASAGQGPAAPAAAAGPDTLASPALPPPRTESGAKTMSYAEIVSAVAELQLKTNELQVKVSAENVELEQQRLADKHEKIAQETADKLEKLQRSDTLGVFGKILGWIGAGIALAATFASAFVTGGGSVAMFAVAVAGVAVMAAQEADVASLCQTEAGQKAVNALLGLASIALAVVSVSKLGQVGAQAVKAGREMAAQAVRVGSQALTAGVQTMSGVTQAATAGVNAGATAVQADIAEDGAELTRIQSMLQEEMDRMAELLRLIQEAMTEASQMIADMGRSNTAIASNINA